MAESGSGEFDAEVRACADVINGFLPALADRHSPLVVLAALTEHVGGALFLCQEAGACTVEQARAVVKEIEEIAFAPE